MYGLYAYIKWIFVVNLGRYSSFIECLGLVHSGFPYKKHQFIVENPWLATNRSPIKKKGPEDKTKRSISAWAFTVPGRPRRFFA